jgi:hypothetical protein
VESSWWSNHLAKTMAIKIWLIIISLVAVCVVSLIWTILAHSGLEQASNVVQVVLGTLLVLFSFKLIFLCVGFQEYSARAEAIETKALGMWDASGELDEHEMLKLWTDYHLSRAAAPTLPTKIWRKKQEKLNATWNDFYAEKFSNSKRS